LCLPPGVVTAQALRRGLAGGFWPVLALELGSLIGDATWAAIALVGAAFLVQSATVRLLLGTVGTLFLLWLAWSAGRDAWRGAMPKAANTSTRSDFATGALLSLTNPLSIAFWLGVGSVVVAARAAHPRPIDFAVFFAGYLGACTLYCFVAAALFAWGRRLVRPAAFRGANLACAAALAYLGLRLLWNVAQPLLQ
jgi:chemosensory pili system protein ChpE